MSIFIRKAAMGSAPKLYVDDVFSAYIYTGTGAANTITTGIDLAGEGGLVWVKSRTLNSSLGHYLVDTARGYGYGLQTNITGAQLGNDPAQISGFSSSGFSVGNGSYVNTLNETFVSWSFAQAAKFFKVAQVTISGSNQVVDLSILGTVGMVTVKRTDGASAWFTLHRSNTAGKICYLNTTAAETTDGSITLSGTNLTLVQSVIGNGTYIVYAWAHDTSADGMIQCGSFTTDASGNASVNLGWEPQYLLLKRLGGVRDWAVLDVLRGWTNNPTLDADYRLYPNSGTAETGEGMGHPTATGFYASNLTANSNYSYIAIRRSNKPPISGAQVYNAIAKTTTQGVQEDIGLSFDLALGALRAGNTSNFIFEDRIRGISKLSADGATRRLISSSHSAEVAGNPSWFFSESGKVGVGAYTAGNSVVGHFFRRAPGVHDIISYTGTGANKTENHNLTTVPELWLVKGRSGATQWVWGSSFLSATEKIVMPTPAGKVVDASVWNSTYPSTVAISLGTNGDINSSAATYVAYLWATLAGVSKVFSYTGDGATGKIIDCGFAAGARFVMIIRTDAPGDIFIWDTVRGIVAGNDPHLSLNSVAAEVTADDSVDPDASGFIVNQVAATNINVSGATYIGLAFA
ncbi:MAG: DUF7483 domain-containing protein [Desulfobulbaceae bacterium]